MQNEHDPGWESTMEAGFTVTELLVVISVGSIVIGYTLAMVLFVLRFSSSWQRKIAVEDRLNRAYFRIALDLERSVSSDSPEGQGILLIDDRGDTVRYAKKGGILMRNNWPLASDSTLAATYDRRFRRLAIHVNGILTARIRTGTIGARQSSKSVFLGAEGSLP
jgi:prepilin-type N-terminal cleavage/methylation domain-containing protein